MTTKETIAAYLATLQKKGDWQKYFADGVVFRSFGMPLKEVSGRAQFVDSTKGFYGMIVSIEVKEMIADGERGCATTLYHLQPPSGPAFTSNVAEVFTVKAGKITTLDIYFDSAAFPRR